jgi:CheY-like chemotaxis protein
MSTLLLYADDDADDRLLFKEIIEEGGDGLHTLMFASGYELVSFLVAYPTDTPLPCCIVIDLNMPGWDGLETLQVIRTNQKWADIPIHIFSTSSSDADRERVMASGAQSFLAKPSNRKAMLAVREKFQQCCLLGDCK